MKQTRRIAEARELVNCLTEQIENELVKGD